MGRRQFTIAEQAEIYECPCGTPDILEVLATMADEEREKDSTKLLTHWIMVMKLP